MSTPGTTITTQTPPANPCPCNGFYCFLQAWASTGGNIILLTFLAMFFIAATVYMMHEWGPASPAVMFIVPIAGGFAGAITMRMGITNTGSSTTTRTPDQH
jgi:hypothetical protein